MNPVAPVTKTRTRNLLARTLQACGREAHVAPIDAVARARADAGARLAKHGEPVRRRHAIVAASADLQERELIKLASLSTAIADALRRRGIEEPTATLTAQAGIAVFTTAFQRWIDGDSAEFAALMHRSLDDMRLAIDPSHLVAPPADRQEVVRVVIRSTLSRLSVDLAEIRAIQQEMAALHER